jgi:hypothetical protein
MKFSKITKYYIILLWTISTICTGQNEYQNLLEFHKPKKTRTIVSYDFKYNKNIIKSDSSLFDISYYDTNGVLVLYRYNFNHPDTSKCNFILFETKIDTIKNVIQKYTYGQEKFASVCSIYFLPATTVRRKYKGYFLVKETYINKKYSHNNETKYYYYNDDESLKSIVIKDIHETTGLKFYYNFYN